MARQAAARKHENDTGENVGGDTDNTGAPHTDGSLHSGEGTESTEGNANSGATGADASSGKTPKKTNEEKQADFNRLMSGRMSRVMDALTMITRLSNTSGYDWTPDQIQKAMRTIREKVDSIEKSFELAKAPTEGKKKTPRQLSYIA